MVRAATVTMIVVLVSSAAATDHVGSQFGKFVFFEGREIFGDRAGLSLEHFESALVEASQGSLADAANNDHINLLAV